MHAKILCHRTLCSLLFKGILTFTDKAEPPSFGSPPVFGQILRMCLGASACLFWDEHLNGHNCVALPLHCSAAAPDELFFAFDWGGERSRTMTRPHDWHIKKLFCLSLLSAERDVSDGTPSNPCLSEWMFNQGLISETLLEHCSLSALLNKRSKKKKKKHERWETTFSAAPLWLSLELFICFFFSSAH